MYKDKIKVLKAEFYTNAIIGIMDANNGYITSKNISELGIHRMYLKMLVDQNIIERIGCGIYIDVKKIEDPYYTFYLTAPNIVFSHMTALYFHGLSIKAPTDQYDITVKRSYHNSKTSKENRFFVSDDLLEVGICEVTTPFGNKVSAYNKERCICDIIRSRKRMDMEHVKYAVKEYLKRKDKNLIKLSKYAEMLNVKEEVMDFLGMMYE